MDAILHQVWPALPRAEPTVLAEALRVEPIRAEHDGLANALPCLSAIAVQPPSISPPPIPDSLRIVSWNAERCKFAAASAEMLRREAPDIVLLTEMDVGMARSGNRDTVADLALELGLGWGFAIEFIELGLGDDHEIAKHAGEANSRGWHGNAILSRWSLEDWTVVRLDDGGVWFDPPNGQRRLGARMAITARLAAPAGPIRLVSVHLENRSTPESRAEQMARMLHAIPPGEERVVVGGDWNTSALPRGELPLELFDHPDVIEPLFAQLRQHGFGWTQANTPCITQRTRPGGGPAPPFRRIDWFAVRGLDARRPRVWAAIEDSGSAISDHEAIAVTVMASNAE